MTTKNIFALDIGTRSVTGIILEKQADQFTVLDFWTEEHKQRSMFDGQIHDVVAVSRVIRTVKEALEERHGPLHDVSVAAAGRALKTLPGVATLKLEQQPLTEAEAVTFLELSAVQAAQRQLIQQATKQGKEQDYYCVGYSILNYQLDGDVIGSLIDQPGDEATVEVIATFLPKIVVESLIAALQRAGLKMQALTLEPIAAINVLIPESMRRLNIALVDIGAGTSDIAITNQGTVVAYGMVPLAGDKITEALSDHYLLDFPVAEQTKVTIVNEGVTDVQDVLGFATTVTAEDLAPVIRDSVDALASQIAAEILDLNQTAPRAVMLVGGGSLTPGIPALIAEKLALPANRVAVRGIEAIQQLTKHDELPAGPDFVTPIGIAIAAQQNPIQYISVTVNEKPMRLFELKQLTVGDCLVQAGIVITKYYGKPGLAALITVDGETITLPGDYGSVPNISVNGVPAQIDHLITDGDEVQISQGADGKRATVSLDTLMGEAEPLTIYEHGTPHTLSAHYSVNNERVPGDYILQDKDTVTTRHIQIIADYFKQREALNVTPPLRFSLNNQEVLIPAGGTRFFCNAVAVSPDYILQAGDHIHFTAPEQITVANVLEERDVQLNQTIQVTFNEELITLKQQAYVVTKEGHALTTETLIEPGDELNLTPTDPKPFIFQDVFRYVDLDLSQATGQFQVLKNDLPTTFYEPIMTGDQLQIKWH